MAATQPRRLALGSALALGFLAASLSAQATVTTIAQSTGLPTVSGPVSYMRGIVLHPDGSAIAVLFENDGTGTTAGNQCNLYRSADDGATWAQIGTAPTSDDSRGVIASGPDCDQLHVAWSALNGGLYYNAYHQVFDVRTRQWLGTPTLLAQGTTANDQFYPRDILVTAAGTVVVSVQAHRTPTLGLGGWGGFLMVKRPQDTTFQGPYQVNTDYTGISMDMAAVGERIHMGYRTNVGAYGLRYREFDAATLTFPVAELQIDSLINNSNQIAADRSGNLYILYGVGNSGGSGGQLRLAYAQAGSTQTWTTQTILADPDMANGNVAYDHFSLASGPGDLMFAVYSKRAVELRQNLYWQLFQNGLSVGPEVLAVTGGGPDTFQLVYGLRGWREHGNPWVVATGRPASSPNGIVQLVRIGGAEHTTVWGQACSGALAMAPRIRSANPPAAGASFVVRVDQAPPLSFAFTFLGSQCQRPPFDLGLLGAPGCIVVHDPAASLGLGVDAAGVATLTLPLPSNPAYAGMPFHLSALVFAPGANALNAVATDSLLAWIR